MLAPDPNQIINLKRIRIKDVRCFEDFSLEFALPSSDDTGQWIILLGDNGVVKSTLLRAIALATADEHVAWTLLERLGGDWVRRNSDGKGLVEVETSEEHWKQEYQINGTRSSMVVHGMAGPTPMVLAYGVGRGTALGGADRAVRLKAQTEGRQTLFYGGALVHAETWLKNLALGAQQNSQNRDFFESVCETLCRLLPGVDLIEVTSSGVKVRGENVGIVSLDSLSDGYLSTLGWTLDMIARWAHLEQQHELEMDGGFNERMTGLVLIDELDLHLHPRWQIEVISNLRSAFPRMSFIATTHNPLTLRGTETGEIHVLKRLGERIVSTQVDMRPGLRTDDLLTGEWFGLNTTLDNDTLNLLKEYQKLAVSAPTSKKIRKLEDTLRERLGSFADTEEERMALKLVAEVSESRPLEVADFKELRNKMKSLLKEK